MQVHSAKARVVLSLAAAGVAALGTMIAVSNYSSGGRTSASRAQAPQVLTDPSGQPGFYYVSWAWEYGNVAEVSAAADVVVVGKPKASTQYAAQQLLFTDFTFDVTSSLKGKLSPGSIVVEQTGGYDATAKKNFEIEDDPLFKVGTQYLLFLQYDKVNDRYHVVGGPQGRLVVVGNKVSSLSAVYPDRNICDLGIDGMALGDVTAQFR